MAAVLAVAATMLCVVNLLSPERLTSLTVAAANKMVDADVKIGRMELSMSATKPLLRLRVDSLTVISGPMARLGEAEREGLPQWGDTLLALSRFEGGINIGALLLNKIDLYDVELEGPTVNLLSVNESLRNYDIYSSQPDTAASGPAQMPAIAIDKFRILNPGPMRFCDLASGEHHEIVLSSLSLEGESAPVYSFDLGGKAASHLFEAYNLDKLKFGVNGRVEWNPEKPTEIGVSDFRLTADFLDVTLSADADFGNDIILRDYKLDLGQIGIARVLSLMPDSLLRQYGLTSEKFGTDVAVGFKARSTAPFNLMADTIPNADMELTIFPGSLRYQQAVFRCISGKLTASLKGNDLNKATFGVSDLNIVGPATDLMVNATATQVASDPLVEGSVVGATDLKRLPAALRDLIGGRIAGRITADLSFRGRPSMLDRNKFHKLYVDGDLQARDVRYVSPDTASAVYADHASFKFGTHTAIAEKSMLTAVVKIDSANVRNPECLMKLKDFKFGVGVLNGRPSGDTTVVVPMGGDLTLGRLNLALPTDSVAFNLRGAHGRVSMKRYNNEARLPLFGLDIDVRRFATKTPTSRVMLSGAKIHATAHKLPKRKIPRSVQRLADSIKISRPDLPNDSVYKLAVEIRRSKRRSRHMAPGYTAEETEIIDWGTTESTRRLLLGWGIEGSVKARRAGLFTPLFPIRNRLRDFHLTFNNDSVVLSGVKYKAGSSDFLISGKISNLKRGLTSKGFRSPLKMNFEVVSDTIDVNEIASSIFRGAAYAATLSDESGRKSLGLDDLDNAEISDDTLDKEMDKLAENAPDSLAPLLIPLNIDAGIDIKAKNILYSDLLFHNFTGRLLASQGALNLRNLAASSGIGSINLSALYSAPTASDLKFGFGMQVEDFNIQRFSQLMPALDSIMPLLHDMSGIIDADIAATCDIDRAMNIKLPSLQSAIRLSGDSLRFIDAETYRSIGKWLLFKDKQDNVIKHMNVELVVKDNMIRLYPFIFDLDRYRLGVQGSNDLAMNFDYHIAVLKSPIPFKFGINIKGNPDKYKIRLGRARLNENQVAQSVSIVDTTRVNLLTQIENVFRRGVRNSRFAQLNIAESPASAKIDLSADTISRADSLVFIREGLIPAPPEPTATDSPDQKNDKRKKRGKTKVQKESAKENEKLKIRN